MLEFRQILQKQIRQLSRQALLNIPEEDRSMLCGPSHRPLEDSPYVRAGSTQSTGRIQGKRKPLNRPRVRPIDPQTGQSSEVELLSRGALKEDDSTCEAVQRAVLACVSSRSVKTLTPEEEKPETLKPIPAHAKTILTGGTGIMQKIQPAVDSDLPE